MVALVFALKSEVRGKKHIEDSVLAFFQMH
jgi:hypothetical protein